MPKKIEKWGTMFRKLIAVSCITSIAILNTVSCDVIRLEDNCICGTTDKLMRATVRHIEAGGIGYKQGYTTLDLFASPFQPWRDCWVPFFEVIGHVFNNGKFAANAGLGARYLGCRIWGVNGYYDYRNTKLGSYNQISVGIESLGKRYDVRMNGYLPLGKTEFRRRSATSFKREWAMSGLDAELAFHVKRFCNGSITLAAGPYYLHDSHKDGAGGKFRLIANFMKYIQLEGDVSWDNIFKTKVQGQFGLSIPFGPTQDVCKRRGFSCCQSLNQRKIALRDVYRKEIIVIREKHKKFRPVVIIPIIVAAPEPVVFEAPAPIVIETPVEQPGLISRTGSYLWSWVPKPWTWF